jgi:hypothetical protein
MTKENRMIAFIFVVVITAAIIALLTSCNPVKKVLKDSAKMQQVFNKGVELGWCVNDTLVVSQSDTLITYDTIYSLDFNTDTYTVDREVIRNVTKVVSKTIRITDTITKVVTDNSRLNLKQKENDNLRSQIVTSREQLQESKEETKQARQQRNKWRLLFWVILAVIIGFILRKPLKFLFNRVSPIKL